MALRPVIQACMRDKCGGIYFSDITGVYHATNNTGGWGTPNLQGSDITEATLTIVFPSGDDEEHDLLSQIPSTVSGDIDFNVLEDTYEDGIYTFTYTVTNGTISATKVLKRLFLCNTQCCVDNMWAKIPEYIVTKDEKFMKNYIEQVNYAQGLLNGLSAAGGCLNEDAVEAILDKIDRLCDFETCKSCN